MNYVDAAVLALLAVADMAFLAQLRRARARRLRDQRMMRCLRLAVQREISAGPFRRTKPLVSEVRIEATPTALPDSRNRARTAIGERRQRLLPAASKGELLSPMPGHQQRRQIAS